MKARKQVAVIVYGAGIDVRAFAADFISRGLLVLYCAGHAEVYAPA